jgi:hypothetical protein
VLAMALPTSYSKDDTLVSFFFLPVFVFFDGSASQPSCLLSRDHCVKEKI